MRPALLLVRPEGRSPPGAGGRGQFPTLAPLLIRAFSNDPNMDK
jgi:hypothetical protein